MSDTARQAIAKRGVGPSVGPDTRVYVSVNTFYRCVVFFVLATAFVLQAYWDLSTRLEAIKVVVATPNNFFITRDEFFRSQLELKDQLSDIRVAIERVREEKRRGGR